MPDLETVRGWGLVLDAEGIPYEIQPAPDGAGWTLIVDSPFARRAADALRAYHVENPPREVEAVADEPPRSWTMPAAAAVLIAFYFLTMRGSLLYEWLPAGAANAGAIRHGEWWRAVTALTLHADIGHVGSNALALALFGIALTAAFGPGVALWLALASGTLGNVANAFVHPAAHTGIGASTAVFGAVGALAGGQYAKHRWRGVPGLRWAPVLAGVLLFALLGTAEHTDVLAHAWGFVVGLGLGTIAGRALPRPPGRAVQLVLTALALLAVAEAWRTAL